MSPTDDRPKTPLDALLKEAENYERLARECDETARHYFHMAEINKEAAERDRDMARVYQEAAAALRSTEPVPA